MYSPRRAALLHLARCSNAACAAATFARLPRQICSAGCWIAREYEKAMAHGARDLKRTFIAYNRAYASSLDWPPDKKSITGKAAGTVRRKHTTHASATSSE